MMAAENVKLANNVSFSSNQLDDFTHVSKRNLYCSVIHDVSSNVNVTTVPNSCCEEDTVSCNQVNGGKKRASMYYQN